MAQPVRIRLLGGFVVERDGIETTVASFERRSGADLIALLALAPGRQLQRDQVLEALWPDTERHSAMGRLNKAATFARNALDTADTVVVRGDTVTLLPNHEVEIDVEVIASVDLDDPDAVASAATHANGTLLPDLLYEEWTVGPRNQLHVSQTQVLRAGERWHRLLELDPTDEGAHLALMHDALTRGDRDGALRRFSLLEDVLERELGVLPSTAALELRDQAAGANPMPLRPGPPTTLLTGTAIEPPRSRTFGRDREFASLTDDVGSERLVTLVGPGGAGKTHLARHVGAGLASNFGAGGWMVELGAIDDPEAAAQAALTAVGGVQGGGATAAEALISLLVGREALLVIDNCEHLLDAATELVVQLLDQCPNVSVLATSREPLGVPGEVVHRVDPLDRTAAVDLFVAEARRQGTELDRAEPAIDRICARLDDLPMAVRLAAARARSLDLGTLESLLADRFELLQATESGALDHQQTLRTTIAWSVNALDAEARRFLTALSVFADRFALDDIAAVTDTSAVRRVTIIDELVRRSLLVGPEPSDDGPRYRLLESVRLFTRGELDDEVRDRHVTHLVNEAARWNRAIGDKDNGGIRHFRAGFDDLRIAFTDALASGRTDDVLSILVETGMFASTTMRFEMLDWYQRALDPEPAELRSEAEAAAYAGWSVMATFNSDFTLARRLGDAVIDAYPGLAAGQWAKAWLPWTHGDLAGGRQWCQAILDNPDPASLKWKVAAMHLKSIIDFADGLPIEEAANILDVVASQLGPSARSLALATQALHRMWDDGDAAIDAATECIALSDEAGLINSAMTGRSALTLALTVHRDLEDALRAVASTQVFAAERGLWSWVLAGLGTAAAAFERAERPDAAAIVLAARDAADYRSGFTARLAVLQEDALRNAHPDRFEGWWAAGHFLSPPDAASYAARTAGELLAG